MAEDDVYKVMLVFDDGREVSGFFVYGGPLPEEGQEIDVENELNPDDHRRARVTRITRDHEPVTQGSLIHATASETLDRLQAALLYGNTRAG